MSRLLAAIYDRLIKATEDAFLAAWRAELLAALSGEVLEVGAGTGLNLTHYPPAVTCLVLAEPDPAMRRHLAKRARERAETVPRWTLQNQSSVCADLLAAWRSRRMQTSFVLQPEPGGVAIALPSPPQRNFVAVTVSW
jgi:hypothetical protein